MKIHLYLLSLLLLLSTSATFCNAAPGVDCVRPCKTLDLTSFLNDLVLCSFLPASILLITASHRLPFLWDRWDRLASFSASSFGPDSIIALIFETTFLFGILYFFNELDSVLFEDFILGISFALLTSIIVISAVCNSVSSLFDASNVVKNWKKIDFDGHQLCKLTVSVRYIELWQFERKKMAYPWTHLYEI